MPNIYEAIRKVADTQGYEVDTSTVNRVAGTLKVAGVRKPTDDLIQRALEKITNNKFDFTVTAQENTDDSGFKKIDDSLKQGKCPRCGKTMADVLLADYTPAKFCKGECRITLWSIDEG